MISKFLYVFPYIFWWLGNLRRRIGKGPSHVMLILDGDYPQLPQQGGIPFLRRFRPPKISLLQLSEQFKQIQEDSRVKTVILHLRNLDMPFAKLDILRSYILDLQNSGKRVIAWSYHYSLPSYYLASAADEIVILPGGAIAPLGISQEYIYLADALEHVGIQADFVQISPYKSAGDMFFRRDMSDEVRKMGNWLAEATWNLYVETVASGRGLEPEEMRSILDQTPMTDLEAQEIGLVDFLLSEDDLIDHCGDDETPAKLTTWDTALRKVNRKPPRKPGKYVAILGIEGIIIDGHSQQPPIEPPFQMPFGLETRAGDLSITQIARRILADDRAACLVVYVDSRGGSATASESISATLRKVAAKKPVIVVMGPVAASGGYYVSTPGHMIFAQKSTITGSIGVISGKFSIDGLIKKLFVNRDLISRGEAALFNDPKEPWSEEQRRKVLNSIQRIYGLFIERVADSRNLTTEDVDAIGGGRVWTGEQALGHGLIDEIGSLDKAIQKARELAELRDDASIRIYSPGKETIPPVVEPTALIQYVVEGFRHQGGKSLCLLPWYDNRRNY